jgi:hypothetical protein
LPKSLVKDSILLRFTAFLTANSDVPVSITAATAPMLNPHFQKGRQMIPSTSARSDPLSDDEALSEFNALQDRHRRPHANRVQYDYRTDSYNWIGPSKGQRMSLRRAEFESEMQD